MMKTILMTMVSSVLAMAAMAQGNGFTVKGRLTGCGDGKIMVTYRDPRTNDKLITDSTEFRNGAFNYSAPIPNNDVVLVVLNRSENGMPVPAPPLRFFAKNGDMIDVSGSCEEFEFADVKGNIYNDQYNELKALIKEDKMSMMQVAATLQMAADQSAGMEQLENIGRSINEKQLAFVKQHPNYLVSAMLLALELRAPAEEVERIYAGFTPEVKKGQYGRMLQQQFATEKQSGAGATAPGFVKKDMNGKPVDLAAFKGKYVLLDFWGSWCGPCRAGNPRLKELYARYKDKGLVIIGIASENRSSLAENRALWLKAIQDDGLPWIQILNNEEKEKTDLVAMYNVAAYPTKILLGPDGKIIGRFMGIATNPDQKDELEEKLKELL